MAHKHGHTHGHHENNSDVRNLRMAFFLNLVFTVVEIAGGFFTNSVAILSDAVHDLGDSLSLALAWYFQRMAKKGSSSFYSYGYKRFSLLGALINSIVLVVGSIFIISKAIPRIFEPEHSTNAGGMVLLAVFGVIVNGAAVFRLNKGSSVNEKVVSLHLLEDVLGWAAILLGATVMYFFELPVIDPLLSLLIAIFVLYNIYKNIRQSLRIILQGIPDKVSIDEIYLLLKEFEHIHDAHDLHIWSIDGNYHILTVHVVLSDGFDLKNIAELKNAIRQTLELKGIQHATIEIETFDEKCLMEVCD
ncbi:MAG TPA: cation diffusion facilitator family transporter [Paludibacter sp.]|nr:cation diffusion facilitator family transporter [Paludibacter sp.]